MNPYKGKTVIFTMTLDTDPREIVRSILILRTSARVCLLMCGYDDDPRELWEIEEVCTYAKRLIDSGLYGAIAFHMRSSSQLKFDFSIFFPTKCANNVGKTHKGNRLRNFDFEPGAN